ncbi:MAG: helix-turn-helix transcriptional regulator [Gemmatimonadaceae bacterium]|nr:helix-turn-helix transcriptional regulator [Gloeobacterales cyanobacterium ES-bin-141]
MGRTLAEKLANLPEERQAKIEARTAELVNEQMSLQQLRKAQKLTQQRLADRLSIKQDGVSRLEKRTDMLLSTLAEVVKFPDRPSVVLQDLKALRD